MIYEARQPAGFFVQKDQKFTSTRVLETRSCDESSLTKII